MALEDNGNYVFDGLANYYKVSANSALNYQTSSASCHFGTAGCALNMNHQPSLQATAGGSFRPVNSSYSLDEFLPFSVQALDSVNRGLVSEHSSQRNFFSSIRVQQPGIEQKCNASGEESSSFEQSTGKRKRRILPNDESRSQAATVASPGEKNNDNESKSKRPKSAETKKEKDDSKSAEEGAHTGKSEVNPRQSEQIAKPPEPPKDYIHVRARRGQATDSHSLAERVRREKISERMKLLQDLVPGCNKITGKAVMVDEIINYVQSLQCQVEFLSMKLEAVNPRLDFNMEGFLSKDVLEPSSMALASDTGMAYPRFHQPDWVAMQVGVSCEMGEQCMGNDRQVALRRIMNGNSPMIEGYGNAKISNVWDDELQNVVRLGVGKNNASSFHI